MNKVIGIISYLPDSFFHRRDRLLNLELLLDRVHTLFNLPILIIAQNYTEDDVYMLNLGRDYVNILIYPKLGITGAREELRQQFLKSDYEVIILLDDDCYLQGNKQAARDYLKQIDDNPGKIYIKAKSLHKLLAFHRDAYKLLAYDLENIPEKHIAYEDRLYLHTLTGLHPELIYRFTDLKLKDASKANYDKDSSWSKGLTEKEITKMSDTTDKLIEERTHKKIEDVYAAEGYVYHK